MEEAIDVQALLTNTGFSVQLIRLNSLLEAAFKQLGSNGPSPSIIHGDSWLFFPDPKLNKDGVAEGQFDKCLSDGCATAYALWYSSVLQC